MQIPHNLKLCFRFGPVYKHLVSIVLWTMAYIIKFSF